MLDEQALLDQAVAAVADLPNTIIQSHNDDAQIESRWFDRIVHAQVHGRDVDIVMEMKAHGFPRDARAAVEQLAGVPLPLNGELRVPMFIAPSISEESRVLLRSRRIAYWDSGGSLYLELPDSLFFIDRPGPKPPKRLLRNIFTGRTTNVLHAMLLEPDREWHIGDLAASAGVAPSTVHQVFLSLEEQLWVERRGKGPKAVRLLRNPGSLLDAWAGEHSLDHYEPWRFYRWSQHPEGLLADLSSSFDQHDIDYALTLAAGASMVAPFLSGVGDPMLLVSPSPILDVLTQRQRLEPVDEGENMTLFVTRDPSSLLFRQPVDHVWVASDVQLYLDLWNWPRRGREQARHLRAERFGY